MKCGKVLYCIFLFAILGVILHKTWQNTKGGSMRTHNLQIETYNYAINAI